MAENPTRAYVLTAELDRLIAEAATEQTTSASAIVRQALLQYFSRRQSELPAPIADPARVLAEALS